MAQWTLAYAALAYTLLHGAEMLSSSLGWPHGLIRVFTIVLLLGAPVVATIAWYHGHRGQQKVTASEFMIIALLLALGGAFLWRDTQPTGHDEGGSQPAKAANAAAGTRTEAPIAVPAASIAVLPFTDLSPDKDQQYFSDGVAEEIINVLAKVNGLKVASRTSSFQYRNKDVGARLIARDLGVRHVLEGSVRKAGDAVRISAQLIDIDTDAHLWSQTFDRPLTTKTIFAVQDEIANAVLREMRTMLQGNAAPKLSTTPPTEDQSAYELFLRAHQRFIARGAGLRESVLLFEMSVATDPKFVRAWAELAAAASVAPSWDVNDREYQEIATHAAGRALALDSNNSLALAAQANVASTLTFPIDYEGAEEKLARALEIDPNNIVARGWQGQFLFRTGQLAQAADTVRKCIDTDPEYLQCRYIAAMVKLAQGNDDDAVADFAGLVAKGFSTNEVQFLPALLKRGDRVGAAAVASATTHDPQLAVALIEAMSQASQQARLEALVRIQSRITTQLNLRAFVAMELAQGNPSGQASPLTDFKLISTLLLYDCWQPRYAEYRKTADFKKLLTAVGLPAYWRKHGWGDHCKPVGLSDFECK